jgi:hypothetical protein
VEWAAVRRSEKRGSSVRKWACGVRSDGRPILSITNRLYPHRIELNAFTLLSVVFFPVFNSIFCGTWYSVAYIISLLLRSLEFALLLVLQV